MERPWEPFKAIIIRLRATNKMVEEDKTGLAYGRRQARARANALDTVRGCPGARTNNGYGCPWGCYSVEAMRRYHKIFDIPVSQILREDLLVKDLEDCPDPWIRIGVDGDPSMDWPLTLEVCRIVHEHGKVPLVITRAWTMPTIEVLKALAEHEVVLHLSMCALDPLGFNELRIKALKDYAELGGKAVMRLVTFRFFETDTAHWEAQDNLYNWGGPVLEQPVRMFRTNPNWPLVDPAYYKPYHTYTFGKKSRWYTAGAIYHGVSCEDGCFKCLHKCYTQVGSIEEYTALKEKANQGA